MVVELNIEKVFLTVFLNFVFQNANLYLRTSTSTCKHMLGIDSRIHSSHTNLNKYHKVAAVRDKSNLILLLILLYSAYVFTYVSCT